MTETVSSTEKEGAIPWWPSDEPAGSLSREQVAQAALEILDREGLAALSMRRLAKALGVGTMSLYWYVSGRDQLLALVVDAVLGEVVLPPDELPWAERVRRISNAFRGAMAAHPAAIPVLAAGTLAGPNALRIQEATLSALRESGLSDDDAVDAYFAVAGLTTSFVFADQSQHSATAIWAGGQGIDALPVARFPHTVELADRLQSPALEKRFAFGLDVLIDGLESRAAASAKK
jgi:TetR/AcrR family tetracycline transcriptional repressor